MLAAFGNTLRIPELRKRILFTAAMIFLCRLISMIPTPGVDWQALQAQLQAAKEAAAEAGGLVGWFDVFSGGALSRCSVGFLGIWPYISAQIILQLMTAIIPSLGRMIREGESGRVKFNQLTRYLSMAICVFQGYLLAVGLENPAALGMGEAQIVTIPGFFFRLLTVISMTTASMLCVWLGDQITSRGIGNGISLIIMVNITSRLPAAIFEAKERYFGVSASAPVFELLVLVILGFLVVAGTVMLTQGVRKVPIHNAGGQVGGRSFGGRATYMPLRVNYSGVMPIIFAGPLLQFPAALLSRIPDSIEWLGWLKRFGEQLGDLSGTLHITLFTLLIFFFSFFWVATQFNAVQIADDLKRGRSYIPGIQSGRKTAEFLDHTMTRVTLIGAVGLVVIAILPQLLRGFWQVPWEMASFFGGTSLLIIVGVALDTLRQMESYLLMRHYDGFLKHGRLQGRGRTM